MSQPNTACFSVPGNNVMEGCSITVAVGCRNAVFRNCKNFEAIGCPNMTFENRVNEVVIGPNFNKETHEVFDENGDVITKYNPQTQQFSMRLVLVYSVVSNSKRIAKNNTIVTEVKQIESIPELEELD